MQLPLGCGRLLAALAGFAAVVVVAAGIPSGAFTHPPVVAITFAVMAPAVMLGLLVVERRPANVVGTLLVALGTVPLVVLAMEAWGATATADMPAWPGARPLGMVSAGAWAWLYGPLVWLALLFPDGRLVSPGWRAVLVASVGLPVLVQALAIVSPETYVAGGGLVPGATPLRVPTWVQGLLGVLSLAGLLGVLIAAVYSIVLRYRAGSDPLRRQIRWFAFSAPLIPAALLTCWLSYALFGDVVPLGVAALGLVFVAFPCSVAVAILRHDLYDIDRLISRTVAYTGLSALLAGLFMVTALAAGVVLGRGSAASTGLAAVGCTVTFSPLRRRVQSRVDRRFYPAREAAIATIRQFVNDVRDGRSSPEDVEEALRRALGDSALRIRYRLPSNGAGEAFVDARGHPPLAPPEQGIAVTGSGQVLAVVVPGPTSEGRHALVREALCEARLPIELSRLQVQLRHALEETAASRARLLRAADDERQRLQRDLHDGAQQRLVALGLHLRHVQHVLPPDDPSWGALDRAVEQLRDAVQDLRQIAHGVRPSALDDGLAAALRSLAQASPVPAEMDLDEVKLPEPVVMAAYYMAAEALANALKHSGAGRIAITLREADGSVTLSVVDDGKGGAMPTTGASGLTGIADRVATVGGSLHVHSPPGAGTRIEAVLPCGS